MHTLLIEKAFAQTHDASEPSLGSTLGNFVPLIMIIVVFYFLLLRPQQKKMKEHKLMINNLSSGNKVVTAGGIIGVITKIYSNEKILEMEISPNVCIRVKQDTILEVITDTTESTKISDTTPIRKMHKKSKLTTTTKDPNKAAFTVDNDNIDKEKNSAKNSFH